MHTTFAASALVLLLSVTGLAAQQSEEVRFAPGNFGTMVTGSITGKAYMDYTLGAQEGQEMFAELTSDSASVNFNILPPGSDGQAIYIGSIVGPTATVTLPETGTYTIRVYQMGNAADSGQTNAFNLDLSIQ